MRKILGQIQLPTTNNKNSWNLVIDEILELPIYLYGCNMESEAFEIICRKLEEELCL